MRTLGILAVLGAAACGGAVSPTGEVMEPPGGSSGSGSSGSSGSGSSGSSGGSSGGGPGGSSGGVPDDDGGIPDDGWSGAGATEASAEPPACASPNLACGDAFPGTMGFATAQDAANALVGRWSFCGSDSSGFYPPDQLGEEYAADGTYYQLIAGTGGQLQRNLDPTAIGNWEVKLLPRGGVEIHTYNDGTQRGGGLSACPLSLELLGVEARVP
jgi:hypothetical protein